MTMDNTTRPGMRFRAFHNALRILNNICEEDLKQIGLDQQSINSFFTESDSVVMWFVRLPDDAAGKVFQRLIEDRQPEYLVPSAIPTDGRGAQEANTDMPALRLDLRKPPRVIVMKKDAISINDLIEALHDRGTDNDAPKKDACGVHVPGVMLDISDGIGVASKIMDAISGSLFGGLTKDSPIYEKCVEQIAEALYAVAGEQYTK